MTLYSQMSLQVFPVGYDPTCEDIPSPTRVIDGQLCALELHRIPDTMEYDQLKAIYLKFCDSFIITYDICNRESFEYAKVLWKEIKIARFEKEKLGNEHPAPIILVGNKTDREAERVVIREEGIDFAKRVGVGWSECSAQYYMGVEEAFAGLVRCMRQKNMWEEQRRAEHEQEKTPNIEAGTRTSMPIYDATIEKRHRVSRWMKLKELSKWPKVSSSSILKICNYLLNFM